MKSKSSTPKPSKANGSVDLVSALGFIREKIPKPTAVSLERWIPELFFELHRPDSINVIYDADHLEYGFMEIIKASKTKELNELSKILKSLFVFCFVDILVGDGTDRVKEFAERQRYVFNEDKDFSELIDKLLELTPENVDSMPETMEYIYMPTPEMSYSFYGRLDKYISNCHSLGAIFLLKRCFHNLNIESQSPKVFTRGYNHQIQTIGQNDRRKAIFDESKDIKQLPDTGIKKNVQTKVSQHNITYANVPGFADTAAMDRTTNGLAYSVDCALYYFNAPNPVIKILVAPEEITSLSFSYCGNYLAVGTVNGDVIVINFKTKEKRSYFNTRSLVSAIAFAPAFPNMFAVGTLDGSLFIFDLDSSEPLRIFTQHESCISFITIHPNAEYVASCSSDGILRVYSVSIAACVRLVSVGSVLPTSGRFSHNGKYILVVGARNFLGVVDFAQGRVVRTAAVDGSLADCEFSPNDEEIALVDIKGYCSLYDTSNLNDHKSLVNNPRTTCCGVAFVGNNEIRVFGYAN